MFPSQYCCVAVRRCHCRTNPFFDIIWKTCTPTVSVHSRISRIFWWILWVFIFSLTSWHLKMWLVIFYCLIHIQISVHCMAILKLISLICYSVTWFDLRRLTEITSQDNLSILNSYFNFIYTFQSKRFSVLKSPKVPSYNLGWL